MSNNHTFETLKHEHAIIKSKHDSKVEAILILSKELENYRNERDQFKLMADQLRERYTALKKKVEGWGPPLIRTFQTKGEQGLVQLLCESKEQNRVLKIEAESLKQKLKDSDGDIKLLREQLARQRVGSFDEGFSSRSFPLHERESLVKDLESAQLKCCMLETDLQAIIDEKEELITTRDEYKHKVERLNQQLNSYLKGDERKLIDIDSILMENRYLQERLQQTQEEKSMVATTLSKYKGMLEKKKTRFSSFQSNDSCTAAVITHTQVQQILSEDLQNRFPEGAKNVTELRKLLVALYEALNDKKIALAHQKKANKILGTRVTELEDKLQSISCQTKVSEDDVVCEPEYSTTCNLSKTALNINPDQPSLKISNNRSSTSSRESARSSKTSFNSGQSRSSSLSFDHVDERQIINDVFDDNNTDEKSNVITPINPKVEEEFNDDLPPSLQKLVNDALDDIESDASSASAVINVNHSEKRITTVLRSNSNSSITNGKCGSPQKRSQFPDDMIPI